MASVTTRSTQKRLLFVTQWFEPEPTFKGLAFAKELQRRGFAVEVVTGFPNYPGGAVYPGYKIRLLTREVIEGVRITRLALYPSHNSSAAGRILNYISFMFSAWIYLTFFARRAEVAYVYHPPLTVGLAATLASMLRRTPIVLDIQDLWPDTLTATGMIENRQILALVGRVCQFVYLRASHIVVLSKGFAKRLTDRGVPSKKISVIHNWADEGALALAPKESRRTRSDGSFDVLFAGNVGRAQGLETLLEAAKISSKVEPRIRFKILGGGLELDRLKARAIEESIANVQFLPFVPMSKVGTHLSDADCLLVHLKDDPLFAVTIPSKTQAYMLCGKPIIMAVRGDAADLVRQAGCGKVCQPENAQELAEAAISLCRMSKLELSEMGASGLAFYRSTLSFQAGVDSFTAIFEEVARATWRKSAKL